jgi:Fungal trichothecene efflux pump (TRI12)
MEMVLLDVGFETTHPMRKTRKLIHCCSNLPIGAAVCIAILFFLKLKGADEEIRKLSVRNKMKYLDPMGVVLLLGAVTSLLLALQWGGHRYSWASSQVIGLLVGFVLILLTFGIVQWKLDETATIPLRILRQRTILFGAIALFFTNWSNNVVRFPGLISLSGGFDG